MSELIRMECFPEGKVVEQLEIRETSATYYFDDGTRQDIMIGNDGKLEVTVGWD